MHQHVRQTINPVRRAARLTGLAALVAGAVAGTGAVTAAPAVAHGAVRSSHAERHTHGVSAKLRHGRLTVRGTHRSDAIALRLEAGRPDVLHIDVGDDGSADFSVGRRFVDAIRVNARGGEDRLRIDESNGVFTDTIPTTLDGGAGD